MVDKEAIPSVKQSFVMTLRHLHQQFPFNDMEPIEEWSYGTHTAAL